jgi:hypothetical protein
MDQKKFWIIIQIWIMCSMVYNMDKSDFIRVLFLIIYRINKIKKTSKNNKEIIWLLD